MCQQHNLAESVAWMAIGRLEAGQTQSVVKAALGISQSWKVHSRIWNLFLETGNARRRSEQGRTRATTQNEDRYLTLTARRNATLLQQHLQRATGTRVSTQTVRNRLYHVGLHARRPMVCVSITAGHRAACRRWAQEHLKWGRTEWSNMLFTEESRFSVEPEKRRIIIWRERGTRNNPEFVHERVRFGGGGVMVWPVYLSMGAPACTLTGMEH
ncbi:hypothetical protein AVEN_220234-1 [Araneus ventricosus]|uniref:Transposase Tc1-like domain-containing protein n=1 Tax=Araneus ventricosus TaxID=182803 RepID=A0A4Y2HFG5_ARAVE|nr:hypothetical protein AVEN_220234-1 [Araneus ventricosus]